jgi:hypothetical protein
VLRSIVPKLATYGAAIKPIDPKPLLQRLQLSRRIVDVGIPFDKGQDPLGDLQDGAVLRQREKRLWPSTIFGSGRPRATPTDGIGLRLLEQQSLLEADLVPPEVAEVVLVGKTLVRAEVKIGERHLLGIIREGDGADEGDSIGFAVSDEALEVGVGPAKGKLDDVVEKGD